MDVDSVHDMFSPVIQPLECFFSSPSPGDGLYSQPDHIQSNISNISITPPPQTRWWATNINVENSHLSFSVFHNAPDHIIILVAFAASSSSHCYRARGERHVYSICDNDNETLRMVGPAQSLTAPFVMSITPVFPLSGTLIMLPVLSVATGMSETKIRKPH